ncbi:MAG TPA: hypothetical protein VG267_09620 [Terracidiphilus sp.]|jgi:hypothetical protein|nr:hypothetical protein [Terracidiphilus sp.]
MKNKGIGNREQGIESIEALLRSAIPPIEASPEPPHDLWPAMQARLNAQPPLAARLRSVPWFDWALAGGLAAFALAFPAAVPMLLYYL